MVELEGYPNRDSMPYTENYSIDPRDVMFRGTLRNKNWCASMRRVNELGYLGTEPLEGFDGTTFADLTAQLIGKPGTDNLKGEVAEFLGIDADGFEIANMEWLGLLGSDSLPAGPEAPVDILTALAERELSLPQGHVLGLGTLLDTLRFRSLLAMRLGAPATQVSAVILGEHGDSMVPIWSSASIGGLPMEKFPGFSAKLGEEVFLRAKTSGAEMIKKKTGAGFAVGVSIAEVIHAIALDSKRILPVSTVQRGAYGLRGVALSVPTVVGRAGAERCLEIDLWPKELQGLKRSGSVLTETLGQVLGRS